MIIDETAGKEGKSFGLVWTLLRGVEVSRKEGWGLMSRMSGHLKETVATGICLSMRTPTRTELWRSGIFARKGLQP